MGLQIRPCCCAAPGCLGNPFRCCANFPAQLDVTLPSGWSSSAGCTPCNIGGQTYTLSNFYSGALDTCFSPNNAAYIYLYVSPSAICGSYKLVISAGFGCHTGDAFDGQCHLSVAVWLLNDACGKGMQINYAALPIPDTVCFNSPWTVPFLSVSGANCNFTTSGPLTIAAH